MTHCEVVKPRARNITICYEIRPVAHTDADSFVFLALRQLRTVLSRAWVFKCFFYSLLGFWDRKRRSFLLRWRTVGFWTWISWNIM